MRARTIRSSFSKIGRTALAAAGIAAGWLTAATRVEAEVPTEPASGRACVAVEVNADRLACYDKAFARPAKKGEEAAAAKKSEPVAVASARPGGESPAAPAPVARPSLLDSRWELFPKSKLGTFNLRSYKPVFVLPWVGAREANQVPTSPSPDHSLESSEGLDRSELEFQIGWKTKAWQGVLGTTGDLWLAYTQTSRWQIFNSARSSPFRETDYEPEILLVFPADFRLAGWDAHLFAVGLDHQSNGRDLPRSRSWNRVTASVGFEREGWTLTVRPWWRIPESAATDDNPDIEDFVGRADVLLVRHVNEYEVSLMLRHTLRGGERSRGAAQLDWAFPLRGNLRGHVQIFHGYGESLIDYNFRTTRIGLGFALIEWY